MYSNMHYVYNEALFIAMEAKFKYITTNIKMNRTIFVMYSFSFKL